VTVIADRSDVREADETVGVAVTATTAAFNTTAATETDGVTVTELVSAPAADTETVGIAVMAVVA
jgi:hypothetical protein